MGTYRWTNLTTSIENDKYGAYLSPTQIQCSFDYYILIERISGNENIIISSISESSQTEIITYSSDATLYKINVLLTVGQGQIHFSVQEGSSTIIESIDYICEAPPTSITISYLRDMEFMDTSPYSLEPFVIIRVIGFMKSILPPMDANLLFLSKTYSTNVDIVPYNKNTYKLTFILSNVDSWEDYLDPIHVALSFPNSGTQIGAPIVDSFFIKYEINNPHSVIPIFSPHNSVGEIVGRSLFFEGELTKGNNSALPMFLLGWGSSQSPVYPILVIKNSTGELYKDTFMLASPLSSLNSPFKTNYRSTQSGGILSLILLENFIKYIPVPLTFNTQSNSFNTTNSVVISRLETQLPLSITTLNSNYINIIDCSPLYLGEGNSDKYTIDFTKFILGYKQASEIVYSIDNSNHQVIIPLVYELIDNIAPTITSLKYLVIDNYLVLQVQITDDLSGFHSWVFGTYKSLVGGTLNKGFYEFIIDLYKEPYSLFNSFMIQDRAGNDRVLYVPDYLTTSLDRLPNNLLEPNLIIDINYEYSDLDVSNESKNNTLYIHYPSQYSSMRPQLFINNFITRSKLEIIVGTYDSDIGAFKFPIHIHQNHIAGEFFFMINVKGSLIYSPMLKKIYPSMGKQFMIQSNLGDQLGPIITKMVPLTLSNVIIPNGVGTQGYIRWGIFIQDTINGFRDGVIIIQSSLDYVKYTFNLILEKDLMQGDKYNGYYEISIPIDGRCKSQQFFIHSAILFDQYSYSSIYNKTDVESTAISPFFQIDMQTVVINTQCSLSSDLTTPELVSFDFNPKTIDVTYSGELDSVSPRLVTFDFETFDLNGLMIKAVPRIYLQDYGFDPISQEAELISYNQSNAKYQCKFEVPFGFGYPDGIRVSVYGIVDNQSNFKGYSSVSLPFSIINVVQTINQNISIISSTELSTSGGDIYITGRQFKATDTLLIQDSDFNILESINPSLSTNTLMSIKGIGAHNREYIYITLKRNTISQFSNSFKLYLKGYVPPPETSSSGSGDNNLSSDSNIPINSPQSCLNQCSGNGECTPNGCVCKSPYVGLDCSSQVIIVPPKINNTIPESNFTIPTIDNNNNVLYAIISVVALNELDNNNNVLNRYSFNQWIVSNNTQSKYQQYTNSTGYIYTASLTNNNDKSVTNLSVSIDYFNINEAINITFANQQLQMNPHSLKYSINITNYSFKSSLSSLQLVLSASIESDNSNNDECSSKQIGDVVDSESEFIKMQIDKNSLYGRFIKRGVIDNRVKYVTNTLLNSEYNAIETTSKSQTYIGINIPFYSKLAQLDPDFSILVDNKPASNNDNAICGARKSKLTGAQIAGIAIGCAAFAAIIVTSSIYYFYKRNQTNKLNANIQNKMKNVN